MNAAAPYLNTNSRAEVIRHAIHQVTCARGMVLKIAGLEDIDADLSSVVTRLQARLEPLDALLDEMEGV